MEATVAANLSSPPLLFFFLGVAAALLRSDLEIPGAIARFLSLYLLFAIGFKGGVALAENPFGLSELKGLLAAMALAVVVPVYTFYIARRRLDLANAAAVAAAYGSISAVTFVTAISYLDAVGLDWSGYMVAAMALMESPAIILGVLLYRLHGRQDAGQSPAAGQQGTVGEMVREACLNGSVFLVLGSLVIGWITGPDGMAQVAPLVQDLFTGILCLFLLDMGIVAMRRLRDLRKAASAGKLNVLSLIAIALLLPIANAALALTLALVIGLAHGDTFLLMILGASASYIAVPAAMRLTLPEANPGIYLPMALAVTFPFNILVGIPVYFAIAGDLLAPG